MSRIQNYTSCFLVGLSFFLFLVQSDCFAGEKENPPVQLDPARAFQYLSKICRIGPRMSGSHGMQKQQDLISRHFRDLNAQVRYQSFDAEHPVNGTPVRMNNMIISWHPESKNRILIACHYDTRPYPERDSRNPRGIFIGANDGASGVALLMELGHFIPEMDLNVGVDFVFFDGEELVYFDRGTFFLGSEYFAKEYRDNPPEYKYQAGILVDMIGDRRLNLYMEKNSLKYAGDLTRSLWKTANDLGIKEFVMKEKHEIQDDHLPLNKIAKIPTCDIIDFDYPYWHTTQDVPRSCSGKSVALVGNVILNWLQQQ